MEETPETLQIEQLVADTRHRIRRNRIVTGLLLGLALTFGWLLFASAVDMLLPMSHFFRFVAWFILFGLFFALIGWGVVRPAMRPPAMQDVAFKIEQTIPGMHNRLVTVLDLKSQNGSARADPAFVRRLIDQTRTRLLQFRLENVVNQKPVRQTAISFGAVLLAIIVLSVICSERMPAAIKRVMLPGSEIAPGSWVKLKAVPGDVNVLQGEAATLYAGFDRGESDDVSIRLRSGDAAWSTYPMQRDDTGKLAFALSAVTKSYEYQLVGGGTWTPVHHVTMIRRPIIETLAAAVKLPDYMKLPDPRPVEATATQISAPLGSTISINATVSGDPTRGELQLFKAKTASAEEIREQEVVWIEDEIPNDAVETGSWKWTAEQVYSGARSNTFNWSRKPYGFATRLNKFTVQPDASVFVYVWIDPHDKPERLAVSFTCDPQESMLAWGTPGKPIGTQPTKAAIVEMGELPAAGKWVRLEAPLNKLIAGRTAPAPLNAVTFGIDKGRVYFDRVGSVTRKKEVVQSTLLEPTGTLPMTLDAKTLQWTGYVPVQGDGSYRLKFYNSRNDSSPEMKAMPVVATTDQPPAIIVEKPGKSVTLAQAEPVPMVVRGFDDYGVAEIGIEVGAAADKFNETKWIAKYDEPQLNPLVISSIDPRVMALAPGASAYYRLVVRDHKGQTAYTEAYRLGLSAAGANDAAADKGAAPLKPLQDSLSKLLDLQGKIATLVGNIVPKLPEGLVSTTQPASLELKNPDGTPMTAEQVKAMLKARFDSLSPEQKQQLTELDVKLTEQKMLQFALAQQLDAAAALAAKQSALALPMDTTVMQEMAERMRGSPNENGPDSAMDKAVLDRLQRLNELTPEQQKEVEQLAAQLKDLEAIRGKAGENPTDANQQLMNMMSQMQGQQAARQMSQFGSALQSQRQELANMRQQIAALQAKAKDAHGKEMDGISEEQVKLDEKTLKELKEAEELLRERLAMKDDERDDELPAPWAPPGERGEAAPVEMDSPEKKDPNKKDDKAAAGDKAGGKPEEKKPEDEKDWWDKPVDPMAVGSTAENDPRFANRDKREREKGEPDEGQHGAETPRDQLQKHQNNFQRHLSDEENELGSAEEQLAKMQAEMKGLMDQIKSDEAKQADPKNGESHGGGPKEGGHGLGPPKPESDSAKSGGSKSGQGSKSGSGSKPGQGQGSPSNQMQQMFASPQMQWAMAAAQRAAMARASAAAMAGAKPGQGQPNGPAAGAVGMGSTQMPAGMRVDLSAIELGPNGASLYRLPPRIREPLIQGMQERGPEAYQRLIDAYYRQLSKDVK